MDTVAVETPDIRSCFIQAVQQTLSNLSEEAAKNVRTNLIRVIGEWCAPYTFSPDFISEVSANVFRDETWRDWLLSCRYVFFMNLAVVAGRSMVAEVIDMVAQSASLDLGIAEHLEQDEINTLPIVTRVPPQMEQEVLGYRDTKTVLAANTWIVVILLALAFVDLEHEVLKRPGSEHT